MLCSAKRTTLFLLNQGHGAYTEWEGRQIDYHGELWALSCHPSKDAFITAGDDKTVRLWDMNTHQLLAERAIPEHAATIAYAPGGDMIAVGLFSGQVMVYDSLLQNTLADLRDFSSEVFQVRFNPDGSLLAAAAYDSSIAIYLTRGNFVKMTTCQQCTLRDSDRLVLGQHMLALSVQ